MLKAPKPQPQALNPTSFLKRLRMPKVPCVPRKPYDLAFMQASYIVLSS